MSRAQAFFFAVCLCADPVVVVLRAHEDESKIGRAGENGPRADSGAASACSASVDGRVSHDVLNIRAIATGV